MQAPTMCELNPSRRRPRDEMEEQDPVTYGASSFGEHRNVGSIPPLDATKHATVN